ncbi:MAG: ABC transporter permease [Treponema sp.]|nr:ABC transporter permease [Treponema sp.]
MLKKEDYFKPIDKRVQDSEFIALKPKSFAADVWERFRENKLSLFSLYLLLSIIIIAVSGPFLSPYPYDGMNSSMTNRMMSIQHWFGTDQLGRDLFTRSLYGLRISLLIGFISTFINVGLGMVYGGIAGYAGGKADMAMMRFVDIIYAVPSLLYIILLMLLFGSNVRSIMLGICISGWIGIARITRAQVITLKERDFSVAAYIQGASSFRILFRHLFVNALGPIIVEATLMVPQAIFMEAFLSFIGVGISAPEASLGTLAQDARMYLEIYPYQMIFPIAMLCLVIFSLNFISEGLGQALNPKDRR